MRKKTPVEEIFDDLAKTTSKIIMRAIMIFPISLIIGTYVSLKVLMGVISNEIWLMAISLGVSFVLYMMTITIIYDVTLEKHIRKICKSKMHDLQRYISDEMSDADEFERRRLIRHLKMSSEKKICNK